MESFNMPSVNHEILLWARESADLSPEAAVKKLGLKAARGIAPIDRLALFETGHVAPTRSMLLKMAKVYRRPLLSFYLSEPPPKGERGQDFRTLPEQHSDSEALVDALVRDIHARQNTVREILLAEGDAAPLPFVASATVEQGAGQVLASMRQALQFDLASYRSQSSPEAAFAFLRAKIEAAGVFVLLIGNLGSYHTNIPVDAFRGFALSDSYAPFIVINDQDSRAAWSFTLLHELTHIWLGTTGVSGTSADTRIERFCNDVAGSFLLPPEELPSVGVNRSTPQSEAAKKIADFAIQRHISQTMVAYNLFRAGLLSNETWSALRGIFRAQWIKSRQSSKEERKEGTGPDYYLVRRHRLGSALLQFVARNMSEGVLTPTKASRVLGVKPRSVAPLLSVIGISDGRAA